MLDDLQVLGLRVEPFLLENGEMAGRLWEQTRRAGLSLGDRAWATLNLIARYSGDSVMGS